MTSNKGYSVNLFMENEYFKNLSEKEQTALTTKWKTIIDEFFEGPNCNKQYNGSFKKEMDILYEVYLKLEDKYNSCVLYDFYYTTENNPYTLTEDESYFFGDFYLFVRCFDHKAYKQDEESYREKDLKYKLYKFWKKCYNNEPEENEDGWDEIKSEWS